MIAQKFDNFVKFDLVDNPINLWTLYLIDDHWKSAYEKFQDFSQNEDLNSGQEYIDFILNNSSDHGLDFGNLAIHFLPHWCGEMEKLGRLVILDFPKTSNWQETISKIIDDTKIDESKIAFLIDLDDSSSERTPDLESFKGFVSLGIPRHYCAYFTTGAAISKPQLEIMEYLPSITKIELVYENGKRLFEWWDYLQGKINVEYFNAKTSSISDWHNPSTVLAEITERDFENFLEHIVDDDPYMVWHWVREELKSEHSTDLKRQYAYLCGKAYFKSVDINPKQEIYYTALRGLLHGLCFHPYVSHLNLEIQESIAPPPLEHINFVKYHGIYTTGKESLECFAKSLLKFMTNIITNRIGDASIKTISLECDNSNCVVKIQFTDCLDGLSKITGGTGTVTHSFNELYDCFGENNKPKFNETSTALELVFLGIGGEAEENGNQDENGSRDDPDTMETISFAIIDTQNYEQREKYEKLIKDINGFKDASKDYEDKPVDILILHKNTDSPNCGGGVKQSYIDTLIGNGGYLVMYTTTTVDWQQTSEQEFYGSICELYQRLSSISPPATLDNLKVVLEQETKINNNEFWEDFSLYSLWHDLKYDRNENDLNKLERRGFKDEAEEYKKVFDSKGLDEAKKLALEQCDLLQKENFSRIPSHLSLITTDQPSKPSIPRIKIQVLYVDDNSQWNDQLKKIVSSFNNRHELFEIKVVFCKKAEEAKKYIEDIVGLQAIVLDYVLEKNERLIGTASIELAMHIRTRRPELPIFGLTGMALMRINEKWSIDRVFSKNDGTEVYQMLLAIIQSTRKRSFTPLFSALIENSKQPTTVFHALPLSHGKSVAQSDWAREFAEFYGEGYFAGESSSTAAPLDSLFSPKRCIQEAKELAAKAFNADHTLFVTSGTTIANSIVYRAVLNPGDVVILDRNCHRSHHYSVVNSGAHVVYLEPEHINKYGISSLVPLKKIIKLVKLYKKSVKMIAITHPTFDGLLYDPKTIIEEVIKICPKIVFLFDEAWLAYGAFHPDYRSRTAMVAAKQLRKIGLETRIYVTQSVHKTLSAMRQASMIHIHDHDYENGMDFRMNEAIKTYMTTSPNLHILASLDVARMQAGMEGFDQLQKARKLARWIRQNFVKGSIRALSIDDLKGDLPQEEVMLDPLKITLSIKGISGATFREKELHEKFGIQINKYTHNTVLALVTIGTNGTMAWNLIAALKVIQDSVTTTTPAQHEVVKIPKFTKFDDHFVGSVIGSGDLAKAYFSGLDPDGCHLVKPNKAAGRISARFVTPYPPGYPILVPGQLISKKCIKYLLSLRKAGVEEVHGLESNWRIYVLK